MPWACALLVFLSFVLVLLIDFWKRQERKRKEEKKKEIPRFLLLQTLMATGTISFGGESRRPTIKSHHMLATLDTDGTLA